MRRWTSSSSGAEPAKCRRLERFERTRSWRAYVARTPRFSRAVATWLTRAANRVFVRCTAAVRYPTSGAGPTHRAPRLRRSIATHPCGGRRSRRRWEIRRATACTGSTSCGAAGFAVAARPRAAVRADRPGADAARALDRTRAARRRLLGRLCARARVPRRAEHGRRRVLDRRHGRDPARAPRSPRAGKAPGRVRGDRLARAPRAAAWADGDPGVPRCVPTAPNVVAYGWERGERARALARSRRAGGRVCPVRG